MPPEYPDLQPKRQNRSAHATARPPRPGHQQVPRSSFTLRCKPAKDAATLVALALTLREHSELDLPADLLCDALDCLIEDWGGGTSDVAGGSGVDWSVAANPFPGGGDACSPATPDQRQEP